MRIAIVGAGISGLTATHLLRERHELVLYEAGAHAGGHTNTIDVDGASGRVAVDTGFIVFNDRNYPNFERLLERLRVPSQPSSMSFSVSDGDRFEYSSTSVAGLFANPAHALSPRFTRMVSDLVRFNRLARELLRSHEGDDGPSLGQWLEAHRFSRWFVERLIVPQASAVWSADPAQMWSFPARFLAQFFENHGMLGFRGRPRWRTVTGGSARYVEAVITPLGNSVRLATPVAGIARDAEGVSVRTRDGACERFDEVVIATHSDQALALLDDPSDREHELLGAFPYQPNEAVLHTDVRMLPRRRPAWASWNYHLLEQPADRTMVTYHMNRLQSLRCPEQYCVTLNHSTAIDPSRVIAKIDYAHPVFTTAGMRAQTRHHEISGSNRTSYCGAYWGWGFHEDGVTSALRACERLGGRL